MSLAQKGLTPVEMMATASRALLNGGYELIKTFPAWDTATSRLFEDEYNIVGVSVVETCAELISSWPDLQGSLVGVISRRVTREEQKSWDGYLVLLTPDIAPSGDAELEAIRYNTSRLRKLVATGSELRTSADVDRAVSPFLPLRYAAGSESPESALELVPAILANEGIAKETTQALIDAFRDQAPLLERLHELRSKS